MAAVNMEHLRSALRRMKGTTLEAGAAGEDLTRRLLDEAKVSWLFVEQERATKSSRLRSIGAKRVDFVVAFERASLLLDAKCQRPLSRGVDGSVTYALENEEIDRLKATSDEFGMAAAVIFWDRGVQSAIFAIDLVGRLDQAMQINGKAAMAATYAPAELSTVALF